MSNEKLRDDLKFAISVHEDGTIMRELLERSLDEIERQNKALGEQVEMVKRWRNRAHNARAKLQRARIQGMTIRPWPAEVLED